MQDERVILKELLSKKELYLEELEISQFIHNAEDEKVWSGVTTDVSWQLPCKAIMGVNHKFN